MLNFPNLYEASFLYTGVFGMSSQTSKKQTSLIRSPNWLKIKIVLNLVLPYLNQSLPNQLFSM